MPNIPQGTLQIRRSYMRDYLPGKLPGILRFAGMDYTGPDMQRAMEWQAWKQRQRDLSTVQADDLRIRNISAPNFQDHFVDGSPGPFWTTQSIAGLDADGGQTQWAPTVALPAFIYLTVPSRPVRSNMNPVIEARVKLNDTTQIHAQFGLVNASGAAPSTVDHILIRNNAAGAAVNWFGLVDNAGATTSVDLGVLGDTSMRKFMIAVDSERSLVIFLVQNLTTEEYELKGTISTNLPAAATRLLPTMIFVANAEPPSPTMNGDFYRLWWDEV